MSKMRPDLSYCIPCDVEVPGKFSVHLEDEHAGHPEHFGLTPLTDGGPA